MVELAVTEGTTTVKRRPEIVREISQKPRKFLRTDAFIRQEGKTPLQAGKTIETLEFDDGTPWEGGRRSRRAQFLVLHLK